MTTNFISENFLLQTKTARKLYHDFAETMPIYDFHSHLPAEQIASDHQFENLTQVWLNGDHYKWRAMRTNGIAEKFITGTAGDYEKFEKWAQTVPFCLGNPLYHWTHLELKNPFGINNKLLNPDTAREIFETTSEMLRSKEFSVRNIIRKMNVKLICTTEEPLDSLEYHKKIQDDKFEIKVHTAWRPDEAMAVESPQRLNDFINRLKTACDMEIKNFRSYIEALRKRHDYFHKCDCRLSDHGMESPYAEDYTETEIEKIFDKIINDRDINPSECMKFKSAMMVELALMDHEAGWVQQLHLGALRNNSTRLFEAL